MSVAKRALALALCGTFAATAQPYTPTSDDEVLERLPPGLRSADVRRQRTELSSDPENLRDSVALAQNYMRVAATEGDARYFAHAQAILAPWWDQPNTPAPILTVRARWRLAGFEFERALAEAERALALDASLRDALAVRFEAQLEQADYVGARRTLDGLGAGSGWSPLERAVAEARLGRVTGGAAAAYRALGRAITDLDLGVRESGADAASLHEALGLLADLAWQLGELDAAERHFAAGRAMGQRDVRQLAVYADFLLTVGRPREALDVAGGEDGGDTLWLLAVEALRALPARSESEEALLQAWTGRLQGRLDARRQRGDRSVLPDEIRFRLRVAPDAALALERARELWTMRRELGDARMFFEAAQAAREPGAAEPVRAWMARHAVGDARLEIWTRKGPGRR